MQLRIFLWFIVLCGFGLVWFVSCEIRSWRKGSNRVTWSWLRTMFLWKISRLVNSISQLRFLRFRFHSYPSCFFFFFEFSIKNDDFLFGWWIHSCPSCFLFFCFFFSWISLMNDDCLTFRIANIMVLNSDHRRGFVEFFDTGRNCR